jgi:hypothetical protein
MAADVGHNETWFATTQFARYLNDVAIFLVTAFNFVSSVKFRVNRDGFCRHRRQGPTPGLVAAVPFLRFA